MNIENARGHFTYVGNIQNEYFVSAVGACQ